MDHFSIVWFEVDKLSCVLLADGGGKGHVARGCKPGDDVLVLIGAKS